MNNIKIMGSITPLKTRITIICSQGIQSIAINLSIILQRLGYLVDIRNNIFESECEDKNNDTLYIIMVHLEEHNKFPKNYIFYQIEQVEAFFIRRYISIGLPQNSLMVWEFSMRNYEHYKDVVHPDKLFYMPFPFYQFNREDTKKENEYDILFYSEPIERRNIIMKLLSKRYKIYFGHVTGNALNELISKSKIILNLHRHKNAALELSRLNEALQFNKLVVSERAHPLDWYNMERMSTYVVFFDEINDHFSNMQQLYDTLDECLRPENYIKKIQQIRDNIAKLERESFFHVHRNMNTYEF
jgi:mannitol/fructose-specific phosphotransferase system IIA component (Ntr-type)